MVVQGTPHHRKDPTGCPSRLDTPCATWRGDRYFRCLSRTFCLPSEIAEFRQTVLLWQSESAPGCCCWSTSSPWATGPPCLDFDWSWSKRRVPRKAAFPCPPVDYSVFHPLANSHFLQPRAKFSDLKKVWWTFDPGIWSQWSRSCHLCLDLPCIHLEWVSTVGYPYWFRRLPGSVVLVHKLSMRMPLFGWFKKWCSWILHKPYAKRTKRSHRFQPLHISLLTCFGDLNKILALWRRFWGTHW